MNPLAALGAFVASVVFGITTVSQQALQADAVVSADRQNSALTAMGAAYDVYDRGSRALAAAERIGKNVSDPAGSFVTDAGQESDTATQVASSALVSAQLKTAGYPTFEQMRSLEDTVARTRAAIALFFNDAIAPGEVSLGEHAIDGVNARQALRSMLVALNNTWDTIGCDFGYRTGKGADAAVNCPATPAPVLSIDLPPGTVREGVPG
ncbi:hypothetical protein QE410_002197 [Microbacterium sp. SORGH_AS 1204]|uniref:hypothetical protein n=1 Tax=Microbacterium sp. SORGH_AS_1204 TaxID=3041785 RepID=UPI00278D633A|nr:hypothetical protein [Microbacterium sp. SORGH_AS_1204]MDQ1137398.1 hypothetical protein [Microbacterium sp. SORGH_AS_1204]